MNPKGCFLKQQVTTLRVQAPIMPGIKIQMFSQNNWQLFIIDIIELIIDTTFSRLDEIKKYKYSSNQNVLYMYIRRILHTVLSDTHA